MSLRNQVETAVKQLIGLAGPQSRTVTVGSPADVEVSLELVAVDTLGSALREIRLTAAALQTADVDTLKTWAEALGRRITYLLENIGPIEVDRDAGHVLIRSTPPEKTAGQTRFYEILLQSHAQGNFSLRRYRTEKNKPGREQVDMHATHEVLSKLVGDLVDTMPAA
jgi:hypothetical protein